MAEPEAAQHQPGATPQLRPGLLAAGDALILKVMGEPQQRIMAIVHLHPRQPLLAQGRQQAVQVSLELVGAGTRRQRATHRRINGRLRPVAVVHLPEVHRSLPVQVPRQRLQAALIAIQVRGVGALRRAQGPDDAVQGATSA
ncbi:hypothetical protein D9M71_225560 [compost metagenome]